MPVIRANSYYTGLFLFLFPSSLSPTSTQTHTPPVPPFSLSRSEFSPCAAQRLLQYRLRQACAVVLKYTVGCPAPANALKGKQISNFYILLPGKEYAKVAN